MNLHLYNDTATTNEERVRASDLYEGGTSVDKNQYFRRSDHLKACGGLDKGIHVRSRSHLKGILEITLDSFGLTDFTR